MYPDPIHMHPPPQHNVCWRGLTVSRMYMYLMQTFSSNMSVKGKPVLKPAKKDTFTCVTFKPDLAKFGMIVLEEQTVSLMRKRVFDLAGVLGKTVKVGCHVTAAYTRVLWQVLLNGCMQFA